MSTGVISLAALGEELLAVLAGIAGESEEQGVWIERSVVKGELDLLSNSADLSDSPYPR